MNRVNKCGNRRSAFSLVELLTVLGILALVLAIVIPVLGNARNAAKRAATQASQADIAGAISKYQIDNKRLPGYFSGVQMGSAENAAIGFTAMENVLLDLAGGTVGAAVPLVAGSVIEVGPTAANKVRVDLALIGSEKQTATGGKVGGYLNPDKKLLVAQPAAEGKRFGTSSSEMPVLVDNWGQPMLAWVENESAPASAVFSAIDSSATKAKFYWNSNAGFLSATKVGRLGENWSTRSVIGLPELQRAASLEGLLGNPAFPDRSATPKPASARGPVLIQSSGYKGVLLDKEARGGKIASGPGGGPPFQIKYVPNQDPIGGGFFDDVLTTAGAN